MLSIVMRSLSAMLIAALITVSASAQVTIVGYDSTNPNGATGDPSPNLAAAESVSDVNPLLFSRGPGLTPNQGITLNSSNWSIAPTVDSSSDDFLEWGWSNSTRNYDLVDLTLQYDISPAGPQQLAIFVNVNGTGLQSIFSDASVDPSDETHTIDLSSFANVSSAQFRLFGFDADDLGGTLDVERFNADPDPSRAIRIRGFATGVPEPGSMIVLGALTIVVSFRRRRCA